MIIAGEASGELYGSYLAKEMMTLDPNLELLGMGGRRMAETGVKILFDLKGLSCIGAMEIIQLVPQFLRQLKEVSQFIEQQRPDLLVLIDFPEFNMRLAKRVRQLNIPIVYYIPPTAWAWRRKRARVIAEQVDRVISIFPFEAEVYQQAGAKVDFVGHPLLDIAQAKMERTEACQLFSLAPNKRIIGLLPGSRQREVKTLWPIMAEAANRLLKVIQDCQFILPLADTVSEEDIATISLPYTIIKNNRYEAMQICDLLIIASGTATLEAACLERPMVIVYKLNWLTWKLGQWLVNLDYIGLPNIVAGQEIVPELLQERATTEAILESSLELLNNEDKLLTMKRGLSQVRQRLGSPGATKRAAQKVLELL